MDSINRQLLLKPSEDTCTIEQGLFQWAEEQTDLITNVHFRLREAILIINPEDQLRPEDRQIIDQLESLHIPYTVDSTSSNCHSYVLLV